MRKSAKKKNHSDESRGGSAAQENEKEPVLIFVSETIIGRINAELDRSTRLSSQPFVD